MGANDLRRTHLDQGDDLSDSITVALILEAISAASAVIGQYQTWRQSHPRLPQPADQGSFIQVRNALLRFSDHVSATQFHLQQLNSSIQEAVRLLQSANGEANVAELPFITADRALLRRRNRVQYRTAVANVNYFLGIILHNMDQAGEILSEVFPQQSPEEVLQEARASVSEHKEVLQVLAALGQPGTTFREALNLVEALFALSNQYLEVLRQEAEGSAEALSIG